MKDRAARLAKHLDLYPHPEGGFYRESYRSLANCEAFGRSRSASTAIYFMLRTGEVSKLHRIKSDEVWHHYEGGTLLIHCISEKGIYSTIPLGKNLEAGEQQQAVVPAGMWFGAEPAEGTAFVLVGCTVAPGFEFADLEFAGRHSLMNLCPSAKAVIDRLT